MRDVLVLWLLRIPATLMIMVLVMPFVLLGFLLEFAKRGFEIGGGYFQDLMDFIVGRPWGK